MRRPIALAHQAAGSNLRILALTISRTAHTQALDIIETSE
jgi:hypothetical protein